MCFSLHLILFVVNSVILVVVRITQIISMVHFTKFSLYVHSIELFQNEYIIVGRFITVQKYIDR